MANLFVNAGHSGSGLLLSPVTSVIIAHDLTGGDSGLWSVELEDLATPLRLSQPVPVDEQ